MPLNTQQAPSLDHSHTLNAQQTWVNTHPTQTQRKWEAEKHAITALKHCTQTIGLGETGGYVHTSPACTHLTRMSAAHLPPPSSVPCPPSLAPAPSEGGHYRVQPLHARSMGQPGPWCPVFSLSLLLPSLVSRSRSLALALALALPRSLSLALSLSLPLSLSRSFSLALTLSRSLFLSLSCSLWLSLCLWRSFCLWQRLWWQNSVVWWQ